jgi:hypothetical protein
VHSAADLITSHGRDYEALSCHHDHHPPASCLHPPITRARRCALQGFHVFGACHNLATSIGQSCTPASLDSLLSVELRDTCPPKPLELGQVCAFFPSNRTSSFCTEPSHPLYCGISAGVYGYPCLGHLIAAERYSYYVPFADISSIQGDCLSHICRSERGRLFPLPRG